MNECIILLWVYCLIFLNSRPLNLFNKLEERLNVSHAFIFFYYYIFLKFNLQIHR
jgi:hypothetical protein